MALRATKHKFTGATTPITAYDYTKTNLGSLMVQNTGSSPLDKFVGPRPISIQNPSLDLAVMNTGTASVAYVSLYATGTVLVAGVTVTGTSTIFATGHVGKLIGFGSTTPASITAWYVIATRASNTVITLANGVTGNIITATAYVIVDAVVTGASGASFGVDIVGMSIGFGSTNPNAITNWHRIMTRVSATSLTVSGYPGTVSAGPYVIVSAMMYPHAITISPTIDWVFLVENSINAVAVRRIFLYEYNKSTFAYTWKGYITATLNTSTAHTIRGFRALRYLHTVGTASASTVNVTGSGTKWQKEKLAVGSRIGFGSTDPSEISTWYIISDIGGDESITISTSAGTVADGPYVIEELRFAIVTTNATPASGGLFLVKGVNYEDFVSGGTTISASTSSTDNLKLVYWLCDAGTTTGTNILTNQVANGCTIQTEISKGIHYAYVVDGTTNAKVYRYNLRASGTITSGKMLMSIAYYTTGTIGVLGMAVTGAGGATFTAGMVGMKIGFNTTSPALVTTWYIIDSFIDSTHITLSESAGTIEAGTTYIIDSADVLCTGNVVVAGTLSAVNNGRVGKLNHGPGKGEESLYFVTTTRIYRAALSNIYAGNLNWISDNRPEIPPGSVSTYPLTNALNSVEIVDACDRLVILTTGLTAFHHYITRYPAVSGDQFDANWGVDDKQQDLPTSSPNLVTHFNTGSQTCSIWSENGIAHIIKHGYTANLCQMYALPLSAHWTFAAETNQRVITPILYTPDCAQFKKVMVSRVNQLGGGEFSLPTEPMRLYFRTKGGYNNTGAWSLVGKDGDLSGLAGSPRIQFMFEFSTIGWICVPARIMSLTVIYDDTSITTDSHFEPSMSKSNATNKQFAWRFANVFDGTVPPLRVRFFDATTGDLILDDYTTNPFGTWEKTTDGITWIPYETLADKYNETTYIRYTPTSMYDNIKVRVVLTM